MATKLKKAKTELESLSDFERRNVLEADRLAVELVDVEARAGAALLDAQLAGEDTGPVLAQITEMRTRLEVAERAASAARARRCAAQLSAWALEAEPLRKQAAHLRDQATAQEQSEGKALAALVEVSGCRWAPELPPRTSDMGVVFVQTPRSTIMRNEAAELERQAVEREARKVPDAGGVYGSTLAELLAAIDAKGVALVPDRHEVRAWFETHAMPLEQKIERAYSHQSRATATVRCELVWAGGRIDGARSSATLVGAK